MELIRAKLGTEVVTDDPMESAYTQVHLFALACKRAASISATDIRNAALGLEFESPAGPVRIDSKTQHLWKRALIGKIEANGAVKTVWASESEIEPNPFPFPALDG
jgi:urea transport system substrate-binding protein